MVASRRFERVFTWLVKFIVASGGLRLQRALSFYGRPQITKLPGARCRPDVTFCCTQYCDVATWRQSAWVFSLECRAVYKERSAMKQRPLRVATPRYRCENERSWCNSAASPHKCTAWKLAQCNWCSLLHCLLPAASRALALATLQLHSSHLHRYLHLMPNRHTD